MVFGSVCLFVVCSGGGRGGNNCSNNSNSEGQHQQQLLSAITTKQTEQMASDPHNIRKQQRQQPSQRRDHEPTAQYMSFVAWSPFLLSHLGLRRCSCFWLQNSDWLNAVDTPRAPNPQNSVCRRSLNSMSEILEPLCLMMKTLFRLCCLGIQSEIMYQ